MHAVDHFYSELVALEKRNRGLPDADGKMAMDTSRSFNALVAPIVGADASNDAFLDWLDRYGKLNPVQYSKLGHIAAFFLGDYDDETMDLVPDDWKALREIVSDAAEQLDLDTLSRLMSDLLSHGALRD
ncbi:hypothetical protein MASR2M78_07330 [Treponema sp.]